VTDVAVSSVVAPAAVTQGSTAAVAVTVQNVGGLNVSGNFDVVLTDSTAGVTLGTQTVAGLGVGATATRTSIGTRRAPRWAVTTRRNPQPERRERGQQPERSDDHRNAPVIDVAVTDVSARPR